MTTTEMKQRRREEIENIRNELTRIRDEIRVRLHLASMDAKDEWTKLEPTLNQLEHAWQDFSHEALNAASTLKARLSQLRSRLEGAPREVAPPRAR